MPGLRGWAPELPRYHRSVAIAFRLARLLPLTVVNEMTPGLEKT